MTKHECIGCKYITKNHSNYIRHINSKKHNKKCTIDGTRKTSSLRRLHEASTKPPQTSQKRVDLEELESEGSIIQGKCKKKSFYKCKFCEMEFSRTNNISRHLKICTAKELFDNEYQAQIDVLNLKITQYEKEQHQYKQENEYYKSLLTNAGGILKKSVGSMAYIINNFKDAPTIKTLEISDIDDKELNNNEKLVKALVYHYNHKIMDKYLGNFIINVYKKDNPSEQSLWNTDYTRLNYLVKELLDNQSSNWYIDKKGVKTKEYIINPMLHHIKCILVDNQLKKQKMIEKLSVKKQTQLLDEMKVISEIISSIDDTVLAEDILRYIGPHFYLNVKGLTIE